MSESHEYEVTFDEAEGRYRLRRDWATKPATAEELERQCIASGYMVHLLGQFAGQYGTGRLVPADGLSPTDEAELSAFLREVAIAIERFAIKAESASTEAPNE